MANTTDAVTLDALAESYAQATGCTVAEAADVLREVGDYFDPDPAPGPAVLPHLVVRLAAGSGLSPARVLGWLHDAIRIVERVPGMDEWFAWVGIRAGAHAERRSRAH